MNEPFPNLSFPDDDVIERTGLYLWCGRSNAYSMESHTVALVWGATLSHLFHKLEDFANNG